MPTTLTDKLVRNTLAAARKPGAKRVELSDAVEPGLRLVAGPRGGVWSFSTTVRENGTRRESYTRIGTAEEISLATARVEARKLKDDLRAGKDPNAERALAAARATTLGAEAERWQPKGRAASVATTRSALRLALEEMALTNSPPEAITKRDLMRLIEMHRARPATARGRLGALRRFYDHLLHQDIVTVNPILMLPRGQQPAPPAPRSGYPSAGEVRALWHAAEKVGETQRVRDEAADILRLLMLCPLRRGEGASLRVGEVDLERAEIRLSAARTKNKRPFVMPLSRQALEILAPRVEAQLRAGRGPDDPVFGQATFSWWRPLERWRTLAGVPNFAPHDLRRLFASECGEHGIGDFDLIDGLLAHSASASRSGVVRSYQHATRTAERRAVMQAWADLVMGAVETGSWRREIEGRDGVLLLRKRRKGDSAAG